MEVAARRADVARVEVVTWAVVTVVSKAVVLMAAVLAGVGGLEEALAALMEVEAHVEVMSAASMVVATMAAWLAAAVVVPRAASVQCCCRRQTGRHH